MSTILKVLAALPILILLCLFIVIFLAEWLDRRHMNKIAQSPCLKCGKTLGIEVVQQARAQTKPIGPGSLLKRRIIPIWNLNCPHCKTALVIHVNEWKISIAD